MSPGVSLAKGRPRARSTGVINTKVPLGAGRAPRRGPVAVGGLVGSAGRIIVGQVEELIGGQGAEFDGAARGYQADGYVLGG